MHKISRMNSLQIYVMGSSNTDMVVKTEKLPKPGETVMGGVFLMNHGGKGANQAVAAARLEGDVNFIASLGADMLGSKALSQFQKEGINTDFVIQNKETPSGVALITVDENGENCIVVAPGANERLSKNTMELALQKISSGSILLLQLEIPISTVEAAVKLGYQKGLKIILNPAPAGKINTEVFKYLYALTPNESEAEELTGIAINDMDSVREAAMKIFNMGVTHVIITLGKNGAFILNEEYSELIEAPVVKAQDTTAAGDCFNGALAVALSKNKSVREAVIFACKAASLSVTKMGAQASMPTSSEIEN